MKQIWLSVLLIVPVIAQADIYRMLDSDGHVIFTDKPLRGASKVSLPPLQSYSSHSSEALTPPLAMNRGGDRTGKNILPVPSSGSSDYYQGVTIASPVDQATIQNTAGQLEVSLSMNPDLRAGDKVMLTIDDEPVGEAAESNVTFKLDGIPRGTHKLQAFIMGADTHILKNSDIVTVYIHQASALAPQLEKI
jgi:hypothetical protein